MAKLTQYPPAKTLPLIERLNLVLRFHQRKMSTREIASALSYSMEEAKRDVATISSQIHDIEDFGAHIKDVMSRTADIIESLNRQETVLWKQLDWANEWVMQLDPFGVPQKEYDEHGKKTNIIVYGPRNPAAVRNLIVQIQHINKQQAEMFGVLNKNVDVTIKLEQAERVQVLIIDNLRDADPALFAKVRRELVALMAAQERPDLPQPGIGRNIQDVIEGQFNVRG